MTSFLEESPNEQSSSRLINLIACAVISIALLWAALAGEWGTVTGLAGILAALGGGSYAVNRLKG